MKFKQYKRLVLADLYRVTGDVSFLCLIRHAIFGEGFQYLFWMRTCRYTSDLSFPAKLVFYPFARLMLRHVTYKLGISIPPHAQIAEGFYIGHFGGIVVNEACVIGRNCNISQGVTLGQANRGKRKGSPIIGNDVYIGPGAKIVGAVRVGNRAAIGANSVVTKDVPDNAVVVGVPGRVISMEGSTGYVNRTDYAELLGGNEG